MSIEDIVRAWKSDEALSEANGPINPIGDELSDQELQEATGGALTTITCEPYSCDPTCVPGAFSVCALHITI